MNVGYSHPFCVPRFIGFAVGRTTFWDPIVAYRDGKASREQAAKQIADPYGEWVKVFKEAEGKK
jgi:myo-inositol catabolism protein IolC